MIADPIGQVERTQYPVPETGAALAEGGGGVFEHSYAGRNCFHAGTSLARWMLHDARTLPTYRRGRPDVDAGRIGATGTSGGGTRSSTSRRWRTSTGSPRDLGATFYERASRREVPVDPQLTAFDLVADCDVQHVLAALEERAVRVERESPGC